MIRTYIPELGVYARLTYDGMDLDDYVMKFATEVKQVYDAAMTALSQLISNNLQV